MWLQISDGNSWNSILPPIAPPPPPSVSYTFRISESFWKTEDFPYENFRSCDTKFFDGKSLYSILPHSPLVVINFSGSKHPQQHKKNLHDISRSCETTYFRRKIAISPLLSRTLIDTRKFLERKKSLLRIFWSCKTKKGQEVVKFVSYL